MIFGAIGPILGGIASIISAVNRPDPADVARVQHQTAKMQAATQRADNAGKNVREAEQSQLDALNKSSLMQQAALDRVVEGFRNTLLRRQ